MRLPRDLISQNYVKPRLFLCETDKTKICELETIEMSGVFKFNSYSELTFAVGRTYTNMITGETDVNPFYDKIEALRLVYLEGFGYFEIQDPEIVSDGIREIKNITANSLEYTLSQKYLEDFYVNTGENNSIEVIEANGGLIVPVTLYNEENPRLSLLDLALEKIYGWKIGHVDESLKTMGRMFETSRASVYDFIVQDICDKFDCFAVFDTIDNTINLYAESLISKHIGDGKTKSFTVSPPYDSIGTVSIDSYKTTAYSYDSTTGILTFAIAPQNGAKIEITDGSQEQWTTDVYVTFKNLAQEVNVSYSADDIKTVLTVKGADDLDIREVNMGLPYIVDLSYYYNVDWMGQDLFDAYTLYLQNYDKGQTEYKENASRMLEIDGYITYESSRLSLQYSIADNVTSTTVGTYYVRGGTYPDYYYTEVKLPDDYNANVEHYYMLSGSDLDETKFSNFYEALKTYFSSQDDKDVSAISDLKDDFAFLEVYTLDYLVTELTNASTLAQKNTAIENFLGELWDQLGLTPLKSLYYEPYSKIKETNEEAGWNDTSSDNYWNYYPVTLVLSSLEKAMQEREETIAAYEEEYNSLSSRNNEIANDALIYNNFTPEQLIRLSSFLREDEYTDDNFIETDLDTIETLMRTKQELLECGRIELSKLCEPKLEFSMDMANIYALPEFEPIIHQFQLGNLINVELRSDYVKRARLLEVNINFDDFSDFSCQFGELTNLKTPSSIHADLLASALTAGKSVASNASYWNKTSDAVTSLSLLIQQGLLDAATVIKAIDGTQGVSIDKYGIHLQKIDPTTGAIDPKEGWIVNNQFLYSDDNFKTTKSVFGEYIVDGRIQWGLLAEAVMAGYIAGCTIEGGTINIGNGAFMVDIFGNVTMGGDSKIGSMSVDDLQDYILNGDNIVYTTCPIHGGYLADEIWIVGDNDYVQTNENGDIVNDSGNIISPIGMGIISDDKTLVLDAEGNTIGNVLDGVVFDSSDNVIGVYDDGRNAAFSIVGYIQDGEAIDSNGNSIGTFSRYIVVDENDSLVGLIFGNYVVAAEITGSMDTNPVAPGSILRSINDGNGVYKSTDWVSALEKYDEQHNNLTNRVGFIEGNLDQHFEFSNNNGLVIKDGNSTIYTRLLNDRWSFMQKDDDPLVGDAEVTYISDKKLYISSAEITGLDGEDGNLDVNGPATVKELHVDNDDASNSLVIKAESNGSFSILIQTQGS